MLTFFFASSAIVPEQAWAAKKKVKHGSNWKKKKKKGKKGKNRWSDVCQPCVGRNRQCEKQISDTHCKACNAYREAYSDYVKYSRRSPSTAMAALVEVNRTVIARTKSGYYPRGICSVIHQRQQFSWTLCPKTCVTDKVWNLMLTAAKKAKTSNGKLNYHGSYMRPDWAGSCRGASRVGSHIFYTSCSGSRKKVRANSKKRPAKRGKRNSNGNWQGVK